MSNFLGLILGSLAFGGLSTASHSRRPTNDTTSNPILFQIMREYDDSSSESESDSSREAKKKREKLDKKKAKTKTKSSKVQEGITKSESGDVDTDKRRKKEKKKKKEKRKTKEKKTKTKAKEDDSSDSEESYAGSCSSAMGGQLPSATSRRGLGDVSRHSDSSSVASAGPGNAKTKRIEVSRKAARPAPSSSSSSSSDSEGSPGGRGRAMSASSKQRSQSSLTSKPMKGESTTGKGQRSIPSNDSGAGKGSSLSSTKQHSREQPRQKLLATSSSSDSSSSDSDRSLDAADLKKLSSRFSSSTKLSKVGNASGPISSTFVQDVTKRTPKRASSTSKLTPVTANESDEEKHMEDLNASSSRITVIDPMSRSVPRISRPPLPTLDGEPDWLFKPKEDKRRGFLGITELVEQKRAAATTVPVPTAATSSTSAESKQSAKALKKSRDKEPRTNQLLGKTSEAKERLFKLLNQDPGWAEERALYNDDLAREIIKENPETAKEKYMFGSTKDEIYPLSMLSALHASVATLRVCHKAYPGAIEFNDQWIGTCLHFACAYRAPLVVLKFLVSKDDDQLEQKNQAGRLPMHLACMVRTPLEKIEFLCSEFKQALSIKDKDGMTPLHLLCNRTDPDVDVVSFLASKNSKTCVLQNGKGCTPLHLAVQHQTPINVLQALLAANNEVFSIPDTAGNLPLHTALQVNAENSIVQFCVWNYSEGLNHYNEKNERPIDVAKRIRKRDTDLHEILEPY